VLLTKLHIPSTGKNLVHRSSLFEKLNEGLKRKLIVISAPAGFGKTTLLSDWINQYKISTAWYSIDKRDNDSIEFLSIIIAGIQTINKDVGKRSLELLKSPQSINAEYIVELLINDILTIESDFILVLDDFHLINGNEIFKIVTYLLEHVPRQLHIVISTRSDPPLPIARLRSRNELIEIRSLDLNFSTNDISVFFNKKLKLGLSIDDLYLLEAKTEGWIAGLQLTALSMQGRNNMSAYIKTIAGDNRYIMDYLIEEVLNIQTEEAKEFLLNTSVLGKISGPLCDNVLQRKNSQLLLESLEKNNMFIVPLDNERKWFRYHHLFADLLKQRLSLGGNEKIREIHFKACLWFEEKDMLTDAIEHAQESYNYDKAMQLFDGVVEKLWENGQNATIIKYAKDFPEETILSNPRFCIFYAWVLTIFGKLSEAEKYLKKAENVLLKNSSKEDGEPNDLLGKLSIVYSILYLFSRNVKVALKYHERAIANLSDRSVLWNSWAYITYGEACFLQSELLKSNESYLRAFDFSKKANNMYLTLIATAKSAFVLKLAGKYKESYSLCNGLLSSIKINDNDEIMSLEISSSVLYSISGFVLTEWNILDDGMQKAIKGYGLSKRTNSIINRVYCALLLSNTYYKIGDTIKAIRIIDDLESESKEHMTPWLTILEKTWKSKLYVINGELEKASDLLAQTEKELDFVNDFESNLIDLSRARLYVAQFEIKKASVLLDKLMVSTEKNNATEMLIEVELLRAKVFILEIENTNAINSVIRAILLAQPEGLVRTFLNEGEEIERLIKEIPKEQIGNKPTSTDSISQEYLNKLLLAFETEKKQKKIKIDDELSNRELDTLKLIAENLSNQEIADRLFISLNTVKTHVRNILDKLYVTNRSSAVIKAKELGII
jgi:LuxR family maltose regulon positive regulatory protein